MKTFREKFFRKRKSKRANVFEIFRPVLLLCTLGGMSTVRYDRKKNRVEYSKVLALFTFMVFVFSCYHLSVVPRTVLGMEMVRWDGNVSMRDIYETVTSQQYIMKLINPIIITVVSILSRVCVLFSMSKRLPKLLDLLNDVDVQLKNNVTAILRKNSKTMKILLLVFLLLSVPFQGYSIFSMNIGSSEGASCIYVLLYNNLSTACVEFQFVCVCYLIYSRFKFINEKLLDIATTKKNNENIDVGVRSKNDIIEYLHRHEELQFDARKCFIKVARNNPVVASPFDGGEFVEEIETLKVAHKTLSQALLQTNQLYNVQLLISVCSSISNVFINLYYSIYGGYKTTVSSTVVVQPVDGILNSVTWALFYFQRFVALCYAASYVTREGNITKSRIANLFRRDLQSAVQEELKNFFWYAIAREESMMVCGLFLLNVRLITAAVATGITYLVILAQFQS